MNIYLIDDHQMFSEAMRTVISGLFPQVHINVFGDGRSALSHLKAHTPDLIILDLEMAGLSGTDLLHILPQHGKDIPVLVCSGNLNSRSISRIRHAGARGYMSKSESLEELKSAITRVIAGDYYPESFSTVGTTENSESSSLLSNRQRAILTLMKSGMSNSEMADTLYLSPNTIKTHIRLMYNTLDVTSRIECINKAETLGLLDR